MKTRANPWFYWFFAVQHEIFDFFWPVDLRYLLHRSKPHRRDFWKKIGLRFSGRCNSLFPVRRRFLDQKWKLSPTPVARFLDFLPKQRGTPGTPQGTPPLSTANPRPVRLPGLRDTRDTILANRYPCIYKNIFMSLFTLFYFYYPPINHYSVPSVPLVVKVNTSKGLSEDTKT